MAKEPISGTWGQIWFEDEEVQELTAFQAKDEYEKESYNQCGSMTNYYKIVAVDGKGSIKVNKVNSRFIKSTGRKVRQGITPKHTIVGKLDDPGVYGSERCYFYGVVFDDLTLFDFEVKKNGSIEIPFTYEDYKTEDLI